MQRFPDIEPADHATAMAEPKRLAALSSVMLMDSLPEKAFDRVVRLVAQVTGVPMGLFSLVDADRQFFKAACGLDPTHPAATGTPLSGSMCQYVVTARTALAVTDARQHPMLASNRAVTDLNVVAYMGTPIHAPDGQVIGSLCAIDHTPREWTEAQLVSLRDLADIIESELALRKSIADRALITSELHHRVKNLFTIFAGIIRLTRREHDSAEALAAELESRVKSLARAHQLIVPGTSVAGGDPAGVPLGDLLTALLAPYADQRNGKRLRLDGPHVQLGSQATTTLALAFHELATNSAKYGALADPDARLDLDWQNDSEMLEIQWNESVGTPVTNGTNGSGFGSQLLEMTIKGQMQGDITTQVTADGMTRRVVIPVEMLDR